MILKGFILDFDGLILDTEIPRFTAWKTLFERNGLSLDVQDWMKGIGTGPTAFDPAASLHRLSGGKTDPSETKIQADALSERLVEQQFPLPGVEVFILNAKYQGFLLGCASSSNREWVETQLTRIGLREYFDCVCTAADVRVVKPDPALYILALQRMKLQSSEVIAFEDSPNGVRAAQSAGIYCIAVPNTITGQMDLSCAERIVNSFLDINLHDLRI